MKTLSEYILMMINKGFVVSKSKCQGDVYNLTMGDNKIMLRKGWMSDKFSWFATPVDGHGVNGKITGDTIRVAEPL